MLKNKIKCIALSLIVLSSVQSIAYAETSKLDEFLNNARQQMNNLQQGSTNSQNLNEKVNSAGTDFSNKLDGLKEEGFGKESTLTTPTIKANEAPSASGKSAEEVYTEKVGDVNEKQLDTTSSLPDSSYFQSKLDSAAASQSALDTAKANDSALYSSLVSKPLSNPFGINVSKKASQFNSSVSSMAANADSAVNSLEAPAEWAIDVDKSKLGTAGDLKPYNVKDVLSFVSTVLTGGAMTSSSNMIGNVGFKNIPLKGAVPKAAVNAGRTSEESESVKIASQTSKNQQVSSNKALPDVQLNNEASSTPLLKNAAKSFFTPTK